MVRVFISAAALLVVATAAGAQTPATRAAKAQDTPDTMVCKRFAETGSLVAAHKVCRTRREWDREQAETRERYNPTNSCARTDAGVTC